MSSVTSKPTLYDRLGGVEDIENIVLAQSNGVPVQIKNIARVSVGYVPRLGKAGRSQTISTEACGIQGPCPHPAEADSGPQGKSEDQPPAKQILPRQRVSHRRLRCMLKENLLVSVALVVHCD
jgi:hypothetical protein